MMKRIKEALKRFYRHFFYTFFKKLERGVRSLIFALLRLLYPPFHPFRLFGVAHGISTLQGREIIPQAKEKWILPKTVDNDLHPRFNEQPQKTAGGFISLISGGYSVVSGAALTAKGELLEQFTEQFTAKSIRDHKLFTFQINRCFPAISHFETAVASLVADCQSNYFHWLFDVLPKLHLLRKADVKVEKFYIDNSKKFQRESLSLLGIEQDQIISSSEHPIISASTLAVTSFFLTYSYPRWVFDFIRETFLPKPPPSNHKRVYISRADARVRHVANESALTALLEKEGFVIMELERLSFLEQIALFKGAEIVVAPHGAGLSNLVFASPGTKVIELGCPRDPCICFWALGNYRSLDYYFLSGEKDPLHYSPADTGHDNIFVDLLKFQKTLELAEK